MKFTLPAGALDRRAEILMAQEARDPTGAVIRIWVTMATVWAEYRPLRAGQRVRMEAQEVNVIDATFRIRWRDGITTAHRLRCDGREYDIVGILDFGRRVALDLQCAAAVP